MEHATPSTPGHTANPDPHPLPLPWEITRAVFFWRLLATCWLVLIHPRSSFMAAPASARYPTGFLIIMATFGQLVGFAWLMAFGPGNVFPMQVLNLSGVEGDLAYNQVLALALTPIAVPAIFLLGAGLTHLFLMIVGASSGGYWATFRVCAYVNGSIMALSLIPPMHQYMGLVIFIWQAVCSVAGLASAHRASVGRVIFGLLLPAAILTLIAVVAVLSGAVGYISGAGL